MSCIWKWEHQGLPSPPVCASHTYVFTLQPGAQYKGSSEDGEGAGKLIHALTGQLCGGHSNCLYKTSTFFIFPLLLSVSMYGNPFKRNHTRKGKIIFRTFRVALMVRHRSHLTSRSVQSLPAGLSGRGSARVCHSLLFVPSLFVPCLLHNN